MAHQEVKWKMLEVRRSIAQLQRDTANYEKDFCKASSQVQEISKLLTTIKPTKTSDIRRPRSASDVADVADVDELPTTPSYAESTTSSSDPSDVISDDTGSVCSSETSELDVVGYSRDVRKSYGNSSLYDLDEKPTTTSSSTSRVNKGVERYRSRRRSQHEIKIA